MSASVEISDLDSRAVAKIAGALLRAAGDELTASNLTDNQVVIIAAAFVTAIKATQEIDPSICETVRIMLNTREGMN